MPGLTWETSVDLAASAARGGLGLLETLRVEGGRPWRLEAHLARMAQGAAFLGLPPVPGPDDVLAFVGPCLQGLGRGVLRLVAVDGRLLAMAGPPPPPPGPVRVAVATTFVRFSGDPLLRHKTLSRAGCALLEREARGRGLFEVVAPNEAGRLTDGARTTLLVARDGVLLTPPVADGALPGVARGVLLDAGLAREAPLGPGDLEGAEAVLVVNALRGALPVEGSGGHPLVAAARGLLA